MITIDNLTKYYDQTCALDRASFTVDQGEILGLLGPNGAGKTTTMRIMTCYLKPTSGTVKVKDFDIHENPLEIKKLIGYLPEFSPLYQDMITYDYLQYVASLKALSPETRKRRIDLLVDLCGLQGMMHKNTRELSRGYKQRVGLAHAMMSDPEILVLDEPTSGLDPNQIVEIRSIIREIGKTKTVLFSTHILSEAETTCDRIVIIDNGRVVANEKTEAMRASVAGTSVIRLGLSGGDFGPVNSFLSSIPGVQRVEQADESKEYDTEEGVLHVNVYCEKDLRAELYGRIKEKEWVLVELIREKRSLENVFRELTKAVGTGKEK